jgi:O-antigen/teichoic acid export membrane protein
MPGARRILAGIVTLLSGSVVARALAAIGVILLARQVGAEAFGLYAASMTLAKITAVGFSLGLDSWLLRAGSREDQRYSLPALTGASLGIKLGGGALWFVLLVLIAPAINGTAFPRDVVALCALIVLCEEVSASAWSGFQAALATRAASLNMVIFQALVLAGTLAAIARGVDEVAPYLVVRAGAAALGSTLAVAWLARSVGVARRAGAARFALRETLPFAASMGLAVVYGSADVTLVAHFLGPTAAGYYAPASTLVATLYLIPAAMYYVMLPVLSRAHATNGALARRMAAQMVAGSATLGVALAAPLALLAGPLVSLVYGPEFAPAAEVLTILALVLGLHCVSFSLGAILAAVGRQGERVAVQAFAAALNVGLNLLIIRQWGITGVAWVFVASEVVLSIGYWGLVRRWAKQV